MAYYVFVRDRDKLFNRLLRLQEAIHAVSGPMQTGNYVFPESKKLLIVLQRTRESIEALEALVHQTDMPT